MMKFKETVTKGNKMKNALLIAAVTLASASAFASKARMEALQNANHLTDTQTIFNNPADAALLPDFVTAEWGAQSNSASQGNAEGGFIRSMDDSKWGLYFGRKSAFTSSYRNDPFSVVENTVRMTPTGSKFLYGMPTTTAAERLAAGKAVYQGQDNPIEFFWASKGDMNWGVSLSYSDSKVTKSMNSAATDLIEASQQSLGIRGGVKTDAWDAYANVGLISTAKVSGVETMTTANTSSEYKGDLGLKVGGSYNLDGMYLHASYSMDGAKIEEKTSVTNPESNKRSGNTAVVGVVNPNKFEGGEFFYGVNLVYTTFKHEFIDVGNNTAADTTYKGTTMALPAIAGVEYDAASWLTVRGSISQNLPFSTSKIETQVGTANAVNSFSNNKGNTTVAAGAGMKFGKLSVDGVFQGSTTSHIGSDANFLTHASVTYNF